MNKILFAFVMVVFLAGAVTALEVKPLPYGCGWRIIGGDTNTRLDASVGDTDSNTWSRLSPAVLQLYSSDIDPVIILREDGTGSIWDIRNSGGYLGQFQIGQYGTPYFVIQTGSGEVGINNDWPTHTLDVGGTGRFSDAVYLEDFIQMSPVAVAPIGEFGRIYVDDSSALCFFNGEYWERIGGMGDCD